MTKTATTIEVDATEIFGLSKATIEDMGDQTFPEGFDGLSGSPGHLWRVLHEDLTEYSGLEIWYLPKFVDETETSPFAMLDAGHTTLIPISREKVAPYIGGFTPPAATIEARYTLPRVLGIVRSHAKALSGIAQSLHDVGDYRPGHNVIDVEALNSLLTIAGKRVLAAAADLLEIDGRAVQHGTFDDVWKATAEGEGKMRLAIDTLPTLVLAAEAAMRDPLGDLPAGTRWYWVYSEAERISRDLMEWVEAHEPAEAS